MATNTKNQAKATKVVTQKVRLSYVHLFEAWSNSDDDKPMYSCTLIIPKSDKKTISAIKKAAAAAAEAGASKHFGGKVPRNLKTTLRDGDEEGDMEKNPELEGCMFMSVRSKTRPGLVDRELEPITDSEEIYSGCYARVSLNGFAYNNSGNRGVSFGLNHVQKLADGEYLGGRSKAEDDFDVIDDDDDDDEDAEDLI
jgi:hypothetical protein